MSAISCLIQALAYLLWKTISALCDTGSSVQSCMAMTCNVVLSGCVSSGHNDGEEHCGQSATSCMSFCNAVFDS